MEEEELFVIIYSEDCINNNVCTPNYFLDSPLTYNCDRSVDSRSACRSEQKLEKLNKLEDSTTFIEEVKHLKEVCVAIIIITIVFFC